MIDDIYLENEWRTIYPLLSFSLIGMIIIVTFINYKLMKIKKIKKIKENPIEIV